jgi:hypothetical protein
MVIAPFEFHQYNYCILLVFKSVVRQGGEGVTQVSPRGVFKGVTKGTPEGGVTLKN